MSANRLNENSSRPVEHLLLWAFALSLAAHLLLYGGFQLGHRLGWWHKNILPAWLKTTQQALAEIKKHPPKPVAQQEAPLLFVEVDPSVSTKEPPKDSKYYSSRNSQADNSDATIQTETPKINGAQTHIPKTQTAPRSKAAPLQPSPPKNSQPEPDTPAAKPKPKGGQAPGDLAMAKPAPHPGEGQAETDTGEAPAPVHKRPRTLAEAKMQQALTGEKMKQEGGVKPRLKLDSLNARATPFGEYDRQLIEAIQNRWYNLLDSKDFSRDRTGRVVVEFRLNFDGRITDMKVVENDVDELLSYVCQRAILDPAPYAAWPGDMRRLIGADYREVRFTFFYE